MMNSERAVELEALVARHGDQITPAQIVEFARDARTALHGAFEWDDTIAGQRYREVQAQQLLRVVVRLIPREGHEEPVRVRAYVSLGSDRGTNIYRPIVQVLSDEEQRAQLVKDARRELDAFRVKYGHLQELAQVWSALDDLFQHAA